MTEQVTWSQTADRNVWAAEYRGAVLTVTHVLGIGWRPAVEWPGDEHETGPDVTRRLSAQRWAERKAGEHGDG